MKNFILLLTIFFISILSLFGQALNWDWALRAGNSGHDIPNSICTDASGNSYIVGGFQSSTISFGSFTIINPTLYNCIFIVKYDTYGNVIWAHGGQDGIAFSSSVDASGYVYVTGIYNSTVTFGNYTLTNNNTGCDVFVVKYDSSGNVLWAKAIKEQGGYHGYSYGMSITNDKNGNIFVAGSFSGDTLVLDSIKIHNPNVGCGEDIFLAKYDSSGNVLWGKRAGGYGGDQANNISTDNNGNIYMTGYIRSSGIIDFDTILFSTTSAVNRIFVAKYKTNGNACWVKLAGSTFLDEGKAIMTDLDHNVYITGTFSGYTINFNAITLNNFGQKDLFVVKYDTIGVAIWAKNIGGNQEEVGTGICTDSENNIYVLGFSRSPSIVIESDTLSMIGGLFVTKYDFAGNVTDIIAAKGKGYCQQVTSSNISIDNYNNLYITGHFATDSLFFGSNVLINDTSCYSDIFYGKLSKNITHVPVFSKSSEQFKFYPNPTIDNICINVQEKTKMEIMNIEGQIIKTIILEQTKTIINFENLSSGIYFIRVITDKENFVRKIIKN